MITLLMLVRATYMYGVALPLDHTQEVMNHTINATPPERMQQWNIKIKINDFFHLLIANFC